MSHIHNVEDAGGLFVIDATTKMIKKPADVPRVVQGDHNSEIIGFSLNAKVIEGHNMAACDRCEIHFTNFNPETDDKVDGVYVVNDLAENDGKVEFSWKIDEEATQIWGALSFSVKFLCFADDGTKDYEWNTLTTGGIPIYPGKDNMKFVLEKYPDFIDKINKMTDHCYEAANKALAYGVYGVTDVAPSPSEWFTFALNDAGTGYIVNANFDSADTEKTEIVIPYEYEGMPVTTIKAGGFSERENIKSIVIPNSIAVIEERAFQDCVNLKKVILPQNLEVLSYSLFEGCTSLTHIDLPKNIKEIQYDVFRKTGIEYMDLPYGIEYLGETLFSESELKRVNIPDTVTRFAARVFYKCPNLEEIIIPNSVTEMGYNQFTSCSNLKRVVIGTGITKLSALTFGYCNNLETVVVPKTVTIIAKDDFWNTSNKPNPNVTLYVEQGSYAEEYAKQYGMKYVYSDITELPKQINPDYDQNDETQPDYIKKRPFYDGGILLGKTSELPTDPERPNDVAISFEELSVGDTVIVEVEKKGVTVSAEDTIIDIEGFVGGEKTALTPELLNDINGCGIRVSYNSVMVINYDYTPGTVRVYKKVLKQLDEKFIPDSISKVIISPDTNGDVISIGSLENGAHILQGVFMFGNEEFELRDATQCYLYNDEFGSYLTYLECGVIAQIVFKRYTSIGDIYDTKSYILDDLELRTKKINMPDDSRLNSSEYYPSMRTMNHYINKAIGESIGIANAELESILAGGVD